MRRPPATAGIGVPLSPRSEGRSLGRREPRPSCFAALAAVAACALLVAAPADALDKQGSAHGGEVQGEASGFGVSGSLMFGSSLYNPTYAARPDNTGLALFRYAGHADIDLIGRSLSIPVDVNMFTDRLKGGLGIFVPTELDFITGITTTFDAPPGAIEIGTRVETDQTLGTKAPDATGSSQTYADVRARYLYRLSSFIPSIAPALHDGDISGYATLGWFVFNPNYFSRPNNTGNALFRYAFHAEVSGFGKHVAFGVDTTFFTDRHDDPLTPSELDLTLEVIGQLPPFALHIAYERDMPVNGNGGGPYFVQNYLYALFTYDFDIVKGR